MKIYNKQNIEQVIWGGALLGSGGGGGLELALQFLDSIPANAQVKIIESGDPLGTAIGGIVAFVGAPDALSNLTVEPLLDAFSRLNDVHSGKITLLVPVETGAVNSLAPLLVALKTGVGVIDADGAGRAVPQLTNLTFSNVIPISPIILSNGAGVASQFDVPDAATAESVVRQVVTAPQFGQAGGLGLWVMDAEQLASTPIWGALETNRAIGEAILNGATSLEICEALNELGRFAAVAATGKFSAGVETTGGGFDLGRTTITQKDGSVLTVYNQNESLFAWNNNLDVPVIVAPNSACYWNEDTRRPFTNADLKANDGANVSLIGVRAVPQLFLSPTAMEGFKNTLAALGYAGVLPRG